MANMKAPIGAKETKLSLVVIRANGSIENRGLVSYYHKNPFIRKAVVLWIKLKNWRNKW